MELRHLKYFVAVAEEGNITRAAERLHISQPPLSRQIRDLEDELGVALFERSAKSVKITEAGRRFLDEARAVLVRVDLALTAVRQFALPLEEFHIGYAPSPTVELLPAILRDFEAESPATRVILHDMTSNEMLAGLRRGELQAALIVDHPSHRRKMFRADPLRSYRVGVAVPMGHPLTRKKWASLAELPGQPLVAYNRKEYPDYHEWLAVLFGPNARKLKVAAECDGALSLVAAVESGRGLAISSEAIMDIAGTRLRFVPFQPAPPPLHVALYTSAKNRTATADRFLGVALGTARRLCAGRT